ncbi:hypothetical protein [Nostoc sp.]
MFIHPLSWWGGAIAISTLVILFPNIVCTSSTNISYAVNTDSAKGGN